MPFQQATCLVLLAFLLSSLIPTTNSTPAYQVVSGNYIYDAYYFGVDSLADISKPWEINGISAPNQIKTTFWGSTAPGDFDIMGGYQMTSCGDTFQRTYENLPDHTAISFTFVLFPIDNWSSTDALQIIIDNRVIFSHYPYDTLQNVGIFYTGLSQYKEAAYRMVGSAYHTGSTLTFKFGSGPANPDASYAFFQLKIILSQTTGTTITEGACIQTYTAGIPVSGRQDSCQCDFGTYYDTTSSTCKSCNSNCQGCFGPTAADCYGCNDGLSYFQDTGVCGVCYPTCYLCSGSE